MTTNSQQPTRKKYNKTKLEAATSSPLLSTQKTLLRTAVVTVDDSFCHKLEADNERRTTPLYFFNWQCDIIVYTNLNLTPTSRQDHFYLLINNRWRTMLIDKLLSNISNCFTCSFLYTFYNAPRGCKIKKLLWIFNRSCLLLNLYTAKAIKS